MVRSKYVHESNGDRSLFSTRSEIERSEQESAYGRERPRLWLAREIARAGRSRPSPAAIGAQLDHHWISSASRTVLSLVESGTKAQPIMVFVWYTGFIPTARARLAATQDPPPDCSLHRCIAGNTGPSAGSSGGELVLHDWWDGWIRFAMDNAVGLQPAQLVSEGAARCTPGSSRRSSLYRFVPEDGK